MLRGVRGAKEARGRGRSVRGEGGEVTHGFDYHFQGAVCPLHTEASASISRQNAKLVEKLKLAILSRCYQGENNSD